MTLIVDIKVVPRSGRNKWLLEHEQKLKCYLKNPPEKGKANKELISLLLNALRMPQDAIELISGATSRNKRVRINAQLTFEQLVHALGIDQQMNIFKKSEK